MQGTHQEGEFRQLEIWTWKSYVRPPVLHNSKQAETSRRFFMDYLRNIGANNYQRVPPGGHNPPGCVREPRRALVGCAHPGPPAVPIFWYISHFYLERISRGLSGGALPSRGGTWAGALLPSGGVIPPREVPSRRDISRQNSSTGALDWFCLVAAEFHPVSLLMIFSRTKDLI